VNKRLSILLLVITSGIVFSCGDDDAEPENTITYEEQLAIDIEIIENYLAENNITAEVDDSGLHYVVHEEGTGDSPDLKSNVVVDYEGRLLSDETVFDSNEGFDFPLNRLITAWQIGLPKIKSGGSITLYCPSGLAYGTTGAGSSIPANANLIFDIELTEVK